MAGAPPAAYPRSMAGDPLHPAPAGSKVALAVLVALVILSPWPFGSAHLRTTQAIALVSLATALGAVLWDGWRGQLQLPPRVLLWPLLGLWTLAVFQLVPLPEGLHHWLAPGSATVWHPDVPAAAAVLGPGPHPISLYPEATSRWIAFATGVVALALAAAPALRDRRLLLRASISAMAGGFLVAVYGLVARLAFGDKLYGFLTVPTIAPFGPFVSKNHFAGYVEMTAFSRSDWRLAWPTRLATVLALELAREPPGEVGRHGVGCRRRAGPRRWGVPVARGRGEPQRGPSRVPLAPPEGPKKPRLSPLALVLALVAVLLGGATIFAVLPIEARARLITLRGDMRADAIHLVSTRLWRDTLRLVTSSPAIGSGFGAFADALPRFKTAAGGLRIEHAENDWLDAGGGRFRRGLPVRRSPLPPRVWRPRARDRPPRGLGLRDGALAGCWPCSCTAPSTSTSHPVERARRRGSRCGAPGLNDGPRHHTPYPAPDARRGGREPGRRAAHALGGIPPGRWPPRARRSQRGVQPQAGHASMETWWPTSADGPPMPRPGWPWPGSGRQPREPMRPDSALGPWASTRRARASTGPATRSAATTVPCAGRPSAIAGDPQKVCGQAAGRAPRSRRPSRSRRLCTSPTPMKTKKNMETCVRCRYAVPTFPCMMA